MAPDSHITAITPTKRDPSRAVVKVGRMVVATLSLDSVDDLGLAVDQPWDDALAAKVAEATVLDKALRAALGRLNRRAMTTQQLDRKLRDLDFDEPTRRRVIDRLTQRGLLNDEAFGRALIRELMSRNAAGPRLLQQKLMEKGLARELIDRLVNEAIDADDQVDRVLAFARGKLRAMSRLDPMTRTRRLYAQLTRRGFDPDTIETVMNTLSEVKE